MTDLDTRLHRALTDAADVLDVPEALGAICAAAEMGRRPRWGARLAGAVAAVAVVAVSFGAVRRGGSDQAYAGWSPAPRAATPEEFEGARAVCNRRAVDEYGEARFGPDAYREVRGRTALLITRSDAAARFDTCVAQEQAEGWYAFSYGERPVDPDSPVSLEGGGGEGAWAELMTGQSATAASVELDVPGLPTATGPVVDGLFMIWWPGDTFFERGHGLPELELRLLAADGQVLDTITW